MSQVANTLPLLPSKKNRTLGALGAVVIGHVGLLAALYNMEPSQLKPLIPPKPIQVRLIQEQKKPAPTPPKPVEPPKPKEVKIVETPPPPPKKVEKVEQVKKETPKPKVAEPPKPAKVQTPTPVVTPVIVETPKPVVQEVKPTPAPVVETPPPAPPAPVAPPQPAVDMTPRNLGDATGVAWKRSPKPKLVATDLDKVTNPVVVLRIDVDANGKIQARVVQSSGNPKVDREMVRAVQAASFQPYKENGVAVPFYAEQPFRVQ